MTVPNWMQGCIEWQGTRYKTLADGSDGGGGMSIMASLSPSGSGPPRHVHADADETFVLLTGGCTFLIDGRLETRVAGQTAFIPKGTEHTFRVDGAEPCLHLTLMSPGGFERFFDEMAGNGFRIPEDMGSVIEVAARFHLTFTGPPL